VSWVGSMKNRTLYALVWATAGMMLAPSKVWADDERRSESTAPPATYQAVLDCRTISDAAARLDCFDKSVAAFATSTQAKDVVVIDRATIRETKRGLFGINLPRLNMFGGNDDVEVDQIESTITAVRSSRDGLSVFILADGSRWQQTDGRFTYPELGQTIVIRRAAMGSFKARV
jgi:hypothetical protein